MELRARLQYLRQRVGRQKQVDGSDTHTNLNRCLTTLQMTAIGLGSTIGVGIYVLLGVAIRDYAGPGVVLSFLLAGLVVLSNALIFMEFGSYIPHTGASYTYMYCAVGEVAAFLTGWMGIFSLTCSAATGARAWSGFIDSLFNNSIQNFFDEKIGQLDIGSPFARSLDWMAFTFFLVLTLVVSLNVQCSSLINSILAILTTAVLVFVTIAGPIVGDVSRLADPNLGGFLPYGFGGVVTGASAAFFAFNGYDSICMSAEEAKNPVKSVPRAILLELLIVTVVYCGAAVGTVCLIPYTDIDLRAPIPSAFAYEGVTWARYIVTIGPVIAMTNLSLMSLYAQSRMYYRMAQDGLMFKKFAHINPVTKVPLLGVVVCGVLVAVIALLLELKDLVRFSVLCMLFQYIVLAPALVALRAKDREEEGEKLSEQLGYGTYSMVSVADQQESLLSPDYARSRLDQTTETHELDQQGGTTPVNNSDRNSKNSQKRTSQNSGASSSVHHGSSSTYSYARDGDLGFGSQAEDTRRRENTDFPSSDRTPSSNGLASNSNNSNTSGTGSESKQKSVDYLVDLDPMPSSETSQSEDNSAHIRHRHSGLELTNSEFADESHLSEESAYHSASGEPGSSWTSTKQLLDSAQSTGCFELTRREFFRMATTKRCLALLVLLLAGLALQLGMAWEDLRRASLTAVLCTALLVMLIVFLCEVIRKRCGPGNHEGFKVPLVPYVPALSCFMNMLLLVSAADEMGIIEFFVLLLLGLIVYVIMVMTQWSRGGDVGKTTKRSAERNGLLSHEDSDADSEGSF